MAYKRKTIDDYEIQGYYSQVWEMVTTEDNYPQAKERYKEYRENEPGTAFRIKKIRIKIENN